MTAKRGSKSTTKTTAKKSKKSRTQEPLSRSALLKLTPDELYRIGVRLIRRSGDRRLTAAERAEAQRQLRPVVNRLTALARQKLSPATREESRQAIRRIVEERLGAKRE